MHSRTRLSGLVAVAAVWLFCARVDATAEWALAWGTADGSNAPILRQAHSMLAFRNKFALFGGFGDRSNTDFLQDAWVYQPHTGSVAASWTQVDTNGAVPAKRAFHSAVLHKRSTTMLVFGGLSRPEASSPLQNFNDIWALDLSESLSGLAWVKLAPPTAPPARHEQVAVMLGDSMFIFGGVKTTGSTGSMTVFGDTWQYRYDINQWRELKPASSPPPRFSHAGAFVFSSHGTSNDRRLPVVPSSEGPPNIVLKASDDGTARYLSAMDPASRLGADTYVGVPSQASSTAGPAPRRGLSPTNDDDVGSVEPLFAVFGGRNVRRSGGSTLTTMLSDTWIMRLGDVNGLPPNSSSEVRGWALDATWEKQAVPGYTFSRIYHSAVGIGNNLCVFGGFSRQDSGGQSVGYIYNDLLRLELPSSAATTATWQVATFGDGTRPPVRYDHKAAVVGNRIDGSGGTSQLQPDAATMFVFGGRFDGLQPGVWKVAMGLGLDGPGDFPADATLAWRPVTPDDFSASALVHGLFTSPHFVIALLSLMMLCFCVFIASFRRSNRRRRFEGALANLHRAPVTAGDDDAIQAAPPGVEASVIDELPRVVFGGAGGSGAGTAASKAHDPSADPLGQTTCAICLCEFMQADVLTELPCRHRYHPPCISQWLLINKHCPLCKRDVEQGVQPVGRTHRHRGAARRVDGDVELALYQPVGMAVARDHR